MQTITFSSLLDKELCYETDDELDIFETLTDEGFDAENLNYSLEWVKRSEDEDLFESQNQGFGINIPYNPEKDGLWKFEFDDLSDEQTEVDVNEISPMRDSIFVNETAKIVKNVSEDVSKMNQVSSSNVEIFDKTWLLEHCVNHTTLTADSVLTPEELSQKVLGILLSSAEDETLQSNLLDLLGFENFDFLSSLVKNKEQIVAKISAVGKNAFQNDTHNELNLSLEPPKLPYRPSYGAQVTVNTDIEKLQSKQLRKEQKRRAKMTEEEKDMELSANLLGLDGDHLRNVRESQLRTSSNAPLFSNTAAKVEDIQYPNVYRTEKAKSSFFGAKMALPFGTERFDNDKRFEEVVIPFPKKPDLSVFPNMKELIKISSLDDFCARGFKGYKELNRLQSTVYPVAYGSNANMLVCAPTGKTSKFYYSECAGKTDVAMLTILRCLSQYIKTTDEGRTYLAKDDFKIVYVAPMKALASEIVRKFQSRLGGDFNKDGVGVIVKELTGDMQLSKSEISSTQILVVTPEKWDVVTRKGVGDTELTQKVKLLLIDEVHLLNEDRGSVIESIVARTLRQVESTQSLIRVVGLSGVKGKSGSPTSRMNMNKICYEKVVDLVRNGHQIMIFVHSRKDTVNTAKALIEEAKLENALTDFECNTNADYQSALKEISKSKNREMKELFSKGFGMHNAGMLRSDRTMTEKFFEKGFIKVLCCTATLAWGVNLPAYAVVIKGTQVYNPDKGGFVDLSILDVLQIFGRAGRPQYEDHGVAHIITTHDKLSHYLSEISHQHPIESKFAVNLVDNLNAEISIGTVSNVDEAVRWLGYTYLNVRLRKNPLNYGMDWSDLTEADGIVQKRRALIISASKILARAQMISFDEVTGFLGVKDLGRTGSNFYINFETIEMFNEVMAPRMTEADVLGLVSQAKEFENLKCRDEEMKELGMLLEDETCVPCQVKGGMETTYGKTNILLQSYISRAPINDFALVSDTAYVAKNAARILRALFEISLSRNWGPVAAVMLNLCKSVDKRMWCYENPIAQFELPYEIIEKLSIHTNDMSVEEMRDLDAREIGELIRFNKMGPTVARCIEQFPILEMEATVAPVTKTVLRVTLYITPNFSWNDRVHGFSEPFYIWVEDPEHTEILHSEYFLLSKKQQHETQKLGFVVPIPKTSSTSDELPPQIYVRAVSERWIGSETIIPISFKHLILPKFYETPFTDLLPLQPLPLSALQNPILEEICSQRFDFFNPVQTQIFHTLYWTSNNALIGAPTGSGKTMAAELAMWAAFRDRPKSKVVYIAPMKALVKERMMDWGTRLISKMNVKMVELTGDITPDIRALQEADIIITTPEKWDGITRSWKTRSYVTDVSLVLIDEIHLLGGDRGPILEVIVSRMNYISSNTSQKVRIVGLSTALANASDLADWLHIKHNGLFNFRHSVRPVPLEIHISGFNGKHYCPRMKTMNKPAYTAILTHSPSKPVIVFVSSRRQTRLTANDFISLCAGDDNPKRFLKMDESAADMIVSQIKDQSLAHAISFGIGLHHAGLVESDRKIVEELFVNGKIQILVATSTLAWGVNYPAHLVIVKGTEFFDAKTKGYVDFPITDVLQMMGRAGRPQFDDSGVACVFVQDVKKNFYKKFLHEPFPVESSLHTCLNNHFNAEIVGGTISSKQDAVDYLTWTYFYRRLQMNPTYYEVEDVSDFGISKYLSNLVEKTLRDLEKSGCVEIKGGIEIYATPIGQIASFYYLNYKTVGMLRRRLTQNFNSDNITEKSGDFSAILRILTDSVEYDELPVRHNEDISNKELEEKLPVPVVLKNIDLHSVFGGEPLYQTYDSPHVKAFLLLQCHLTRNVRLPTSDYITDTNSVLDQSIRILQAMIDITSIQGLLSTTIGVMRTLQCIKQAMWHSDSELLSLPYFNRDFVQFFSNLNPPVKTLKQIIQSENKLNDIFSKVGILENKAKEIINVVANLPVITFTWLKLHLIDFDDKGNETQSVVEMSKDYKYYLTAGKKYSLSAEIRRRKPKYFDNNGDIPVSAPRFSKKQIESWWIVLGNLKENELILVKRSSIISRFGDKKNEKNYVGGKKFFTNVKLDFIAPMDVGDYKFELSVISDAYYGLDVSKFIDIVIN
ncbi:hypothetical protein HK099_000150 [Clydaea vesicula]|uniref:Activating signal cointegrator 1 complex subunit 3 n=1 Tax=Clydaea vesicula TaxID=447962 RepID=A0AAD5U4N0_9FUNG|nr:hypothetical protein HK099_000150 [Clydaea vesicula]